MLRERGEISGDLMLMVDERYRQKGTQYQREKYVVQMRKKMLIKELHQ